MDDAMLARGRVARAARSERPRVREFQSEGCTLMRNLIAALIVYRTLLRKRWFQRRLIKAMREAGV